MNITPPTLLRALGLLACSLPAAAHDGHGLTAAHWHATDAFGLVLVGGLAALAIWLSRGGK